MASQKAFRGSLCPSLSPGLELWVCPTVFGFTWMLAWNLGSQAWVANILLCWATSPAPTFVKWNIIFLSWQTRIKWRKGSPATSSHYELSLFLSELQQDTLGTLYTCMPQRRGNIPLKKETKSNLAFYSKHWNLFSPSINHGSYQVA